MVLTHQPMTDIFITGDFSYFNTNLPRGRLESLLVVSILNMLANIELSILLSKLILHKMHRELIFYNS